MVCFFSYADKKSIRYPLVICAVSVEHLQEPIYRPKGMPYFQWFLCCEGKGKVTIKNSTFSVNEGQGFFINEREPYSYKGISENFKVYCICFNGVCVSEILCACNMKESGVYYIGNPEIFIEYTKKIMQIYEEKQVFLQKEFAKQCFNFLVDLGECIHKLEIPFAGSESEPVCAAIHFMEEHFQEPVTLDDLSEKLNLSKGYLCTIFKKEMGYSITQYLLIIRIGWARLYLEQFPEKNVYEIGKMCGFDSASYFVKKFKESVGVTPEKYKYVKTITTSLS